MAELDRSHAENLLRLCVRYGIAVDYVDAGGSRRVASDETLQALLGEFGVDASTDAACVAALENAERAARKRGLPPVVAIDAGSRFWNLTVHLAETQTPVRWTVTEEQGEVHSGAFDVRAMSVARSEHEGAPLHECRLQLNLRLPPGYHRLRIEAFAEETLIVAAPRLCHTPASLSGNGRIWGTSVQLYSLRSERNWGIGDFSDLEQVVAQWGGRGADIIGVNPLHAMFPHDPHRISPYSPSSRLGINVLYIDIEAMEDFAECTAVRELVHSAAFQARLIQLRESACVDYAGVAAAKLEVLEKLYAHFRQHHRDMPTERGQAFRDFRNGAGAALHGQALFEALQAHFHAVDGGIWGWPVWPEAYRDSTSEAVRRFAAEHAERIEWYEYLQWQAQSQLARVTARCHEHGLTVGLYLDLAVSVDRAGADTWRYADEFAHSASVGAPPDDFNQLGQNWCLAPLRPDCLRAARYDVFIQTLRANMRHAGALRIDHVMGLMRLFWVPYDKTARDGAYVLYPLQELLAIVALESMRNRCMVIGEDLGTVAAELRTAIAQRELLSYKLLYFERGESGEFTPPAGYPRKALVAVSTHDLATLAGWWNGTDLRTRHDIGLFPDNASWEKMLAERAQDRVRLMLALEHAGLLPMGESQRAVHTLDMEPLLAELVHVFVARTPSRVMMVQIEDAIGLSEQANMPGTTDSHPNWRRKLPLTIGQMAQDERISSLAKVLALERPRRTRLVEEKQQGRRVAKVPRATYRLQLHARFNFDAAAAVVPYLARLGVSHVYCSPIFRARPGSTHGYDIVAYDEINPELGGWPAFERFSARLRQHHMGLLLDMVPNHMGVLGADNPWWMDVLENGCASLYASYFDIDWNPANPSLAGKVLLPVLDRHYGDAILDEAMALRFEPDSGALVLHYHEHRFPLDPSSYASVLLRAGELANDENARATLSILVAAFKQLPSRESCEGAIVRERHRDKERHKSSLSRLYAEHPDMAQAIAAAIAEINASGSRDALHELLDQQAYRLAYWRVAADEINYRRFFDIDGLAALRMENQDVFEATHDFVLDLAAAGFVDGLRIDHPDGLRDPGQYLQRLQRDYARRIGQWAPAAEETDSGNLLYVVVEKITAPHEHIPQHWWCSGSTGYRFANAINGVLVDASARPRFDRIWHMYAHDEQAFDEIAYRSKHDIMQSVFAAELTRLATALLRIAQSDRCTRDYTFNTLRRALVEVTACMPVYRTYIVGEASKHDLRYVDWAVKQARQRSRDIDTSVFGFVRLALLAESGREPMPARDAALLDFAMRFQQFSSPVAAKGVEDTAFYRYHRLTSLNEVGGDPGTFGIAVRTFHNMNSDRALRWPHTMLTTSTHDNKRSEDVRNRINVLTENPAAWRLILRRWSSLNRRHRTRTESGFAPSAADEYLLYQTLIGSCPVGEIDEAALADWRDRISNYMSKAAHEAKLRTSWINPDREYDAALNAFVAALMKRVAANPFLDDLRRQAAIYAWFGALNSLSATLVKLTAPGVADIYQGNESMDFSLVDPDNRRPVDYARNAGWLDEMEKAEQDRERLLTQILQPSAICAGRAKLYLTWRLLELRRQIPALFRDGAYVALRVRGARDDHAMAYARTFNTTTSTTTLIVVAGRLFARLLTRPGDLPVGNGVWSDTAVELPFTYPAYLENVVTGERRAVSGGRLPLAEAFSSFPAAAFIVIN